MTDERRDALAHRVAEILETEPMPPARQAAFDRELSERIVGSRLRRRWAFSGVGLVSAAAAVALVVALPNRGPALKRDWVEPLVAASTVLEMPEAVIETSAPSWWDTPDPAGDLEEILPKEYAALSVWFDAAVPYKSDNDTADGGEEVQP